MSTGDRRRGAYADIVDRANERIRSVVERVPTMGNYVDKLRELASAELEVVRHENLSREQLLEQLAIHRAALTLAAASKARSDELAHAFAELFSEVATKVEAAPRAGGEALAKVNRTATGQTFAQAKEDLRAVWLSGAYPSKNQCAAGEHERLGLSLKTARNTLSGVPSAGHGE